MDLAALTRRAAIVLAVAAVAACAARPSVPSAAPTSTAAPPDTVAPTSDAAPPSPAAVQPAVARLVALLRDGGQVAYLRHAATDSALDQAVDLDDCSTQRNLSGFGREQAKTIGAALRAQGVRVGVVLASPYCRTRDTAELAFGRVTADPRLAAVPPAGSGRARVQALRSLLAASPEEGVTVLVGHTANIERATGALLDEGGALVVTPDGDAFRQRGVIPAAAWATLTPPRQ